MSAETSAEAVERLARCLDGIARQSTTHNSLDRANASDAAATLRALLAERDRLAAEVASLRLTLGGKTFSNDVPEPIGCPAPGACATVAEIVRLREALTKLADAAQFAPLDLSRALTNARAGLAGGRGDD